MLTPSSLRSLNPATTVIENVTTTAELEEHFHDCVREQFTGRLDLAVKALGDQPWNLYFYSGRLIGCVSKIHPLRRWCRQLSLHCPQLTEQKNSRQLNLPRCWDYDSLIQLMQEGKIPHEQVRAVIKGYLAEILFDIYQLWQPQHGRHELQLTYKPIARSSRYSNYISSSLLQIWQPALEEWNAWQQADLTEYSPNWSPIIWNTKKLEETTSPTIYKNLTSLVDGKKTVRDLAIMLNQKPLLLLQSILPYIRQELIGLVEIGDYSSSLKTLVTTSETLKPVAPPRQSVTPNPDPHPTAPLIACIDDSRIDSQKMRDILIKKHYQCLMIQDPLQALPLLLEKKPSIIFLDLIMPIANGYEICAQIRRVSTLKTTPIIILTSSDGIVDRVRAKMVGASGFLAKPIDSQKVLVTVKRYLSVSKSAQHSSMKTVRI